MNQLGSALVLALVLTSPLLARPAAPAGAAAQEAAATGEDGPAWVDLKGGLRYRDLVVGDGDEARPGRLLQVHYTGWLEDGTVFDSSRRGGNAYAFVLGAGTVVDGWEKGIVGMRAGGKRELLVPPKLGYGARGVKGRIPPSATLRFEIELLSVSPR